MTKTKEWIIRTISGVVFVAVIVFCILYSAYYIGWALFAAIGVGCTYEWLQLMKKTRFNLFIKYIFPFFYIGFPIISSCFFCYDRDFSRFLLFLFIIIWVNDTMAFVVGSLFGKHKLSRHSPSKTWEGAVGGIIFSACTSVLIWYFFAKHDYLIWWILFGITISIASVLGDLFESYIKRKANVKDSGKMMPGHGGFLDRFDSFLFAAPTVVILLGTITLLYDCIFLR